jgi:hypothetical protein
VKLLKLLKRYDWRNYIIYYSIYGIMILIALWVVLSYFNVVAHNSAGDETFNYWRFNFFRIFNLFRR